MKYPPEYFEAKFINREDHVSVQELLLAHGINFYVSKTRRGDYMIQFRIHPENKSNDMKYELQKDFRSTIYSNYIIPKGTILSGSVWESIFNKEGVNLNGWLNPVSNEPENDYEILSFINKNNGVVCPAIKDTLYPTPQWQIHSVKRLPDGEVFTVRDVFFSHDSSYADCVYFEISSFELINGKLFVGGYVPQKEYRQKFPFSSIMAIYKFNSQPDAKRPPLGLRPKWIVAEHRRAEILEAMQRFEKDGVGVPDEWYIELGEIAGCLNSRKKEKQPELACSLYTGDFFIEKGKQPLLTTEDGVKVYCGDRAEAVELPSYNICTAIVLEGEMVNTKYFSTRVAAEAYAIIRKPILSLLDCYSIIGAEGYRADKFRELAKQKLSK